MSHNDIQDIDTSDFYSFGCYPMQRYTAIRAGTIGLFKTEAVGRGSSFLTGPLRTIDDVEYATMEWVDWYRNRRHSRLDYVPPDEHEAARYAQTHTSQPAVPQP
jgi:putative transposase